MHLFRSIRYELSGQEIESVTHPGQATTMLGLLKYPDDFSKSKGLNQLWYKDTTDTAAEANAGWEIRRNYIIKNSDPKGSFSFKIPLKHILGFCEDYDKVVYGLKHAFTLTRNIDNDAIFKNNAEDAHHNDVYADGKIMLSNISLFMPHVTPAIRIRWNFIKLSREKKNYRLVIE